MCSVLPYTRHLSGQTSGRKQTTTKATSAYVLYIQKKNPSRTEHTELTPKRKKGRAHVPTFPPNLLYTQSSCWTADPGTGADYLALLLSVAVFQSQHLPLVILRAAVGPSALEPALTTVDSCPTSVAPPCGNRFRPPSPSI